HRRGANAPKPQSGPVTLIQRFGSAILRDARLSVRRECVAAKTVGKGLPTYRNQWVIRESRASLDGGNHK
ncbi:MAG: hypothetical protein ACREBC_19875, partial [Pyrinomonadaceae bacterium]